MSEGQTKAWLGNLAIEKTMEEWLETHPASLPTISKSLPPQLCVVCGSAHLPSGAGGVAGDAPCRAVDHPGKGDASGQGVWDGGRTACVLRKKRRLQSREREEGGVGGRRYCAGQ